MRDGDRLTHYFVGGVHFVLERLHKLGSSRLYPDRAGAEREDRTGESRHEVGG